MKCFRCSCDAPNDARFCPGCGANLISACLACGVVNACGDKFCKNCGEALAAGDAGGLAGDRGSERVVAPTSYTPKRLAEKILTSRHSVVGERKQISVLFADIKGSMELLADRDPEEARALLDPVLKLMMEAVHRYEGTVNQVMGDGIMALFGAPLAHEDHAVRACYAALRIQKAIGQYAQQAMRDRAIGISVRVGLNSGEVVVRSVGSDLRMDYTAVGQTTHLAARMEQMAEPGTILITADGVRAAEGFVQVRPLGPTRVKGLIAPVDVFEVTGAGAVRTRLQAAAARGLTHFVGQEAALAKLCSSLALARVGQGQLVSIVGEGGVGKSRLLYEFIRSENARDWLILETGATSYGRASSYLPVVHLLRDYFKLEELDDAEQVRRKISSATLALDPTLTSTLVPVLALLDVPVEDAQWQQLSPAQRRRATFNALKRLMLRQAQEQPLILVFEDLHAIDTETEALLNGLIESIPAVRALVIATYRPEYRHKWGNKSYLSQLRLDPLGPQGARALLQGLLGPQSDLQPVLDMLIERTHGNPFFLEEGVRTLTETGVLSGEPGAYRLTKAMSALELQIPPTVQSVLAARIDRLASDEKWLLQSAAVIGRDVPFSLLQSISEDDEDTLRGFLQRLQEAEFLYETSLFPELKYTFKHALTQEVAYNQLLHETRRSLHGRIVDALERSQSSRSSDQVDRLALHAVRGELWSKAITYLRQAGLKACDRSATREAVACVEQALAALSHLPESNETIAQAIDLRFDLHSALIPLGDFPRIVEILREAEELADRLGDRNRQGRVWASMATWCWCIGEPERALEYAQRARATAIALEDRALEALANHREGEAHVSLGNLRQAIDAFARNLLRPANEVAAHRYGMAALQSVTSRNWMAWCMAGLGEFDAAFAAVAQSVEIAEAANHPYSLAATYLGLGQCHQIRGQLGEAIPPLERAVEITVRANFGPLYKYGAPNLGLAYVRTGRVQEGLELLERLATPPSPMDIIPFQTVELINLSEGRLAAGQRAAALECAERGLALTRSHRQRLDEPEALRVLGDLHASQQPANFPRAEACYREAISQAEAMHLRPLLARCHLHLGAMHAKAGEHDQATVHLTKARELLRQMAMQTWLAKAEAELRGLRGECAPGDSLFDPDGAEFHANPYPSYHRLRAEDPVHRAPQGYWVVTRYADVVTVLRDRRFGREDFGPTIAAMYGDDSERVPRPMVFRDPPAHTRLRSLVNKAFTSRVVEDLRPHIQAIVDRLVDRVEASRRMDLIADLAYPLPVTVICEMLGAPAEDADTMRQWTSDIARSLDALGLRSDREIVKRGRAARHALGEYFRALLPERRHRPRADLLSHLLAAEESGDTLSEDELIATCVLIFIAGHETTVNLIGNGLLALLQHPEQLARLRVQPELIPGAVEELLRYDSPVQRTARVAAVDVELGGVLIPKHSLVVAAIGAANRDPQQFADPDRLDVTRTDNHHVAFGFGIHFCLGAALARFEAQITIATLLHRLPGLALTDFKPAWRESSTLRGLTSLPVTF
jgi:cytochrome P450/predicted ATPase/class 3 adenylate cyclase